jgi:hypothetical protein
VEWDGIYLGRRKGKDLVYAGKVDHGFDKTSAAALRKRLTPLIRKTQPYTKKHIRRSGWSRSCWGDRVQGEVSRRQGAAPILQGATGGLMTELDANRVPRHTGRDVDNAAPTEAA